MRTPPSPRLDRSTFGSWRRRRYYSRRLRQLDRLDARARRGGPGRGRGDGPRTLLVLLLTGAIAVIVVLLQPGVLPVQLRALLHVGHGRLMAPRSATGDGPYAFMSHQPGAAGVPVSYDPCRPIHVEFNPTQGPPEGERLVREAMATASRASGFRFIYDGQTPRRPQHEAPPSPFASSPPVLVSFSSADEDSRLAGDVAGVGGSRYVERDTGVVRRVYTTGEVTLDADAFRSILAEPDGYPHAEAVVLHEFGHLLGLAHVPDSSQLMYAHGTGLTAYQGGDLRGLAVLGAGACS